MESYNYLSYLFSGFFLLFYVLILLSRRQLTSLCPCISEFLLFLSLNSKFILWCYTYIPSTLIICSYNYYYSLYPSEYANSSSNLLSFLLYFYFSFYSLYSFIFILDFDFIFSVYLYFY